VRAVVLSGLLLGTAASVFAQQLTPVEPEQVGLSSERLARLTEVLQGYVERDELSGGVLLVARDGGLAYHQAFGLRDRESADTMRVDDIIRIASQTQSIVTVAVMMLRERGALLLSDPLSRYLPEFEQTSVAVARNSDG